VLSEFRGRLLTNQAERRLFDVMLSHFRERGWVKERGKPRTDSTHVLAAIRAVNRLECVGEPMRHALNVLAEVAPDGLIEHMLASRGQSAIGHVLATCAYQRGRRHA
jgi:transposase